MCLADGKTCVDHDPHLHLTVFVFVEAVDVFGSMLGDTRFWKAKYCRTTRRGLSKNGNGCEWVEKFVQNISAGYHGRWIR